MSKTLTARLCIGPTDPRVAARLRYSFGAYAALYDLTVVTTGPADVVVAHGPVDEPVDVVIPDGYRVRPGSVPAPSPVWVDGLPSFHRDGSGRPDPLGEVFEWLAAPHEDAAPELDAVGRVPPRYGLARSHGLDLTVPWANRWLARLHTMVRSALPRLPEVPPSPFGSGMTFVASHDLDHLSGDRLVNARRVAKNAAIAFLHDRAPRTTAQIGVATARRVAAHRATADGVRDLLAGEAARGVTATYTAVAASGHRRDPGYRLDDDYVRRTLAEIVDAGHELAVHGSYRSLEGTGLRDEYAAMRAAGYPVRGGRQHWLRHRGGELFTALADSGAEWDSTLGYPDDVGYRHGAAFPFPPYDLTTESPHPLIEIPLAIMERALCATGDAPRDWTTAALDVLRASTDDGWGGVAVLWHDAAFTGTCMPAGLADVYWALLEAGDRWETAGEVAHRARSRWTAAQVLSVATTTATFGALHG
ncbi:hypothetical protein ACFPK1_27145 [Actinomycetospora rhizophila]|uniref:Polysaccharide deacetylase n=1 Tax=Actinomycetospora rhizophila TaxID=1416876 RepID=A0ABV9ZN96_9PSEU